MSSDATSVAAELTKLAEDPRFSSRTSDLKDLVVDIVDPEGDAWAEVNLFAAFPADSTVRAVHRRPGENVVGAIAGAMVFAPVAWTWWGFHDASKAYKELIADSGDPEGTTFLSLWASGFDGRMDGFWGGLHQLVPMAMGSLLLVAAAVVAVVLHRAIATRNVRREEESAEEARILLTSALTKAQRIVSARRADHPLRIEGIIKSSMEQLRAAHEDTASATRDLAVTAADVKTSIASLLDTVKSAGEEAASIMERANHVNETVSTAIAKVETSVAGMETVVNEGVRGVEGAVTTGTEQIRSAASESSQRFTADVTASLGGFGEQVQTSLSGFSQGATAAIKDAGGALRETIGSISSSAERTAQASSDLSKQVVVLSEHQETAQNAINAAVTELRDAVLEVEATLARHDGALQGQVSELTGVRDGLGQIARRLTMTAAN
jgi:ABC-type transporter Mla subunit MlaD